MNNFVQDGKNIDYVNTGSAIAAGAVIEIPGVGCGVAVSDIAATTGVGPMRIEGVVRVAKETGTGAVTVGQKLYWDSGNSRVTLTKSSNTLMGFAAAPALTGDATVDVKLTMLGDAESTNFVQAAVVAALTEDAGAIGGSNDGNLPDLDATGATLAGSLTGGADGTMEDVADIALSTSNIYSDAAVNTAVNAAILATNLQLKELQVMLNAVIADNVALRAGIRENAAKINGTLSSLKTGLIMASA